LKVLKCGAGVGPIILKRGTTKDQGGKGYPTCNTTKEGEMDKSQIAWEVPSETRKKTRKDRTDGKKRKKT